MTEYVDRFERAQAVMATRWTGGNMAEVLALWSGFDVAVNSAGNPVVYCGAGNEPLIAQLGDWVARSDIGPEVWSDAGFRAAHWAHGILRRPDPATIKRVAAVDEATHKENL